MQPRQLALAKRPKHSNRPIVEDLPCIHAKQLRIPSIYDRKTYVKSLLFPEVASITISSSSVDFHHKPMHRSQPGEVQSFKVKHIRTGLGFIRHAFYCHCGRAVMKLYFHNRHIACRYCHRAKMASQSLDQRQRPILQITRLSTILDQHPRLRSRKARLEKKLGKAIAKALRS
jgi:hypothetical protein